MKLVVVGTGFVGLATAVVFADWGHEVVGLDVDAKKIQKLKQGQAPFHEAELDELLVQHLNSNKLKFTTEYQTALTGAKAVFICVGTPSRPDGSIDLKYIKASLQEVILKADPNTAIVVKSTVPPSIEHIYRELYRSQKINKPLHFATNPEFLVEGQAINDTRYPERIVIGTTSALAKKRLHQIYSKVKAPKVTVNVATAQMVKYASNSLLSLKISFVNELARLSDQVGSDITQIVKILAMDHRIAKGHMQAGLGFGGSCFPKDTSALIALGAEYGLDFNLLVAARQVNQTQTQYVASQVQALVPDTQAKIAVLGIAFKPHTDDIRDSKSIELVKHLQLLGYQVTAHDPLVKPSQVKPFNIPLTNSIDQAVKDASMVVIATEWPEYRQINWSKIKTQLKLPYLVDGRNMLSRKKLEKLGFIYNGIGQ